MPTETESSSVRGENRQISAGLAELNDRLDDLWVKYLDCLDQYQRAQESVQKALSSVRQVYVYTAVVFGLLTFLPSGFLFPCPSQFQIVCRQTIRAGFLR